MEDWVVDVQPREAPFGVAWDLDGVVVDTTADHFRAWQALLAEHGMQLTYEEFLPTFGSRDEDVIPKLWAARGRTVSPEEIKRLSERKEHLFRTLLPDRMQTLPGVESLMQSLHQAGARQAIATSTPRANLEAILKRLPPLPIQATVTGEEVQRGKPAPDVFFLAAERLGVPPNRMVVIEDAPQGIAAAHAAGMPCLAITTTRPAQVLAQAGADRIVTTFVGLTADDIRALLDRSGSA